MFLISAFRKGQSWLICESLRPEAGFRMSSSRDSLTSGISKGKSRGAGRKQSRTMTDGEQHCWSHGTVATPQWLWSTCGSLEHLELGQKWPGLYPRDHWTWAAWEQSVLGQHSTLLPSKIPRGLSAWGRPWMSRTLGGASACPPQSPASCHLPPCSFWNTGTRPWLNR